jgi:hypothetical protein
MAYLYKHNENHIFLGPKIGEGINMGTSKALIPVYEVTGSGESYNSGILFQFQNIHKLSASGGEQTYSDKKSDTKSFIKLIQSYKDQLLRHNEIFSSYPSYQIQEKIEFTTSYLLSCSPEKISLQLTNEGSAFFTLVMKDRTIYFEHYLIDYFDDTDEALVTIRKGDKNLLCFGGKIEDAFTQLRQELHQQGISLPEFA